MIDIRSKRNLDDLVKGVRMMLQYPKSYILNPPFSMDKAVLLKFVKFHQILNPVNYITTICLDLSGRYRYNFEESILLQLKEIPMLWNFDMKIFQLYRSFKFF